jgi:hypothetical protein
LAASEPSSAKTGIKRRGSFHLSANHAERALNLIKVAK